MIQCIAIDDEPLALQQIKSYIEKISFLELVAVCHDALDAYPILLNEKIDVIFVDINMPDINGLDFVRSLDTSPLIIFTTAYSEYAIESYKVDAIDYLLKPFGFNEFQHTANKILRIWNLRKNTPSELKPPIEDSNTLFLKSDYRIVRINIQDIIYIEGMSEYLRLFLASESKPVVALLSIHKILERLPANQFMRVHRSYIINLKKIREVNRLRIMLENKEYIPIGESYKEEFFRYLNNMFLTK